MAKKRMFTAPMAWDETVPNGAADWVRAADSIEAQEDIEVVGVSIEVYYDALVVPAIAANHSIQCFAEVSQGAQEEDEGIMAMARLAVHTQLQGAITPNVAIIQMDKAVSEQFNVPFTVSEDGDINLHVFRGNDTGSTIDMHARAIIYYTKD